MTILEQLDELERLQRACIGLSGMTLSGNSGWVSPQEAASFKATGEFIRRMLVDGPALVAEIRLLREWIEGAQHHAGCSGAWPPHPCKCDWSALLAPTRKLGEAP